MKPWGISCSIKLLKYLKVLPSPPTPLKGYVKLSRLQTNAPQGATNQQPHLISAQLISDKVTLLYHKQLIPIHIILLRFEYAGETEDEFPAAGSICDELTKCRKNLNLQLPTGSGLINESDLCYGHGSEILVTYFFDFSDSSCPDPTTLHTHRRTVYVCLLSLSH